MPVVTTIKLTGDNHKDVDMVCATIKAISDKSGVALRGPIPCLLYTSPSPRDRSLSRMPSSA